MVTKTADDKPPGHGEPRTAQLRRRRDAAMRSEPLGCCADPWTCRHHDGGPSEKMTVAAHQAAQHLLDQGLTPMLDIDIQRRLWRRGGDDRRLVAELHALAAVA